MAEPVVLDFAARRRPDIVIKLPEGEFPISGDIYVDDMGDLAAAEQLVREALVNEDENAEQITHAVNEAHDAIMYLIRKRTPEAPDLRLTPAEVLAVIFRVSGNVSALQGVFETISLGALTDAVGDFQAAHEPASDEGEQGAESRPLASSKRSRKRSSGSAKGTSGRRTTGKSSRGESGAATGTASELAST